VNTLASEFQNLNTVHFTDEDALPKISLGHDEMISWFGDWSEPVKLANTLFRKEVFNEQRPMWIEAGCLFIALCIHRATLEQNRGEPFGHEWGVNGAYQAPVRAIDYLGFARFCFNSGLSYPAGVRIAPNVWRDCLLDLGICISQAKLMETSALELYQEKKGEGFTGEAVDGSANIQSVGSMAFEIIKAYKS
jgi:hypothetical protein